MLGNCPPHPRATMLRCRPLVAEAALALPASVASSADNSAASAANAKSRAANGSALTVPIGSVSAAPPSSSSSVASASRCAAKACSSAANGSAVAVFHRLFGRLGRERLVQGRERIRDRRIRMPVAGGNRLSAGRLAASAANAWSRAANGSATARKRSVERIEGRAGPYRLHRRRVSADRQHVDRPRDGPVVCSPPSTTTTRSRSPLASGRRRQNRTG